MICVMENYDNDMMIMIVVMTVQNTNPRFCSPDLFLSLLDWVLSICPSQSKKGRGEKSGLTDRQSGE